jgi:lipopolysaccharide export system permease protein
MAGPQRFISAVKLDVVNGRLERPILDEFGAQSVTSQLDARDAFWDPAARRWVFEDGVERRFADGRVVETAFRRNVSEFDMPPRSLIPETTNPDEMSFRELLVYIRQMRRLGAPVAALLVAAHAKAAYPFANLVICALGIPIALRLRRSPKVVSFCVVLALSFFYLWVIELGKALGTSERLPPVLAAWSANFVFAGLAAWLMRRWEAT